MLPVTKTFGLTPSQKACFEAIRAHRAATGLMPTMDELRTELGLSSRGAVHRVLTALTRRGVIERSSRKARAIRIVVDGCPHCGGELP